VLELLSAHAPGQTGETRLMAIKLRATSERPIVVILALEEDFLEVAEGEIMVAEDKTANKRLTAATPELLREAEDGE
jgi:hypothetical protein